MLAPLEAHAKREGTDSPAPPLSAQGAAKDSACGALADLRQALRESCLH